MNATALTLVGVDIAKNVFQLHWVDAHSGEIHNICVKRAKFLAHFVARTSCLVGMEACGGAQHWARELIKLGHEVKLLPGKAVKAFVTGNKSDAIDARAVWMALRHGQVKPVAIKTEAQQAVLALHRMRQQLVKMRTMQINELRGLLTEYGEVFGVGRAPLARGIAAALDRLAQRLPQVVIDSLHAQWLRVGELDQQVGQIELRLKALMRCDPQAQRIAQAPGVGLLTATALTAAMGSAEAFRSGREFAAWLGLVPAHTGSGGKTRNLGLSKRGDTYLRTLLIHGARSVLTHTKQPSAWVQNMRARRPENVVTVAQANKTARIVWAMLKYGRDYQPDWTSRPPVQPHHSA